MAESIHITTTTRDTDARPWASANWRRMLRCAREYRGTDFVAVDDPKKADYILFVDADEHFLGDVRRAVRRLENHERAFVYCHNDAAVALIPGIYPDLPGPCRLPDLQLGGFYLRCFENELLSPRIESWRPQHLFSFVGNVKNAPLVRRRILKLEHPRGLVLDRSSGLRDDDADYVSVLRASMFVICPRGLGPTSWRFYETMMASRVPVIVSDRWVPARELPWDTFSLRVPEDEVSRIPALCEEHAANAREMGRAARAAWEEHCSVRTAFGWVGRRLRELREACAKRQTQGRVGLMAELRHRGLTLEYMRSRVAKLVTAG